MHSTKLIPLDTLWNIFSYENILEMLFDFQDAEKLFYTQRNFALL
jgi:hypothetical protein